jgi:hypothetical protein
MKDFDSPNKRDKSHIQMNIIPVKAGEEIELKQSKIRNGVKIYLKPFHVSHGGHPALGYTIVSKTTKTSLKEEYIGVDGKELGKLARSGVQIKESVTVEKAEVCYTGDTSVDGLVCAKHSQDDSEGRSLVYLKQGFTAPLILCELTFLDPNDKDKAKERGHLNVQDIDQILSSHGWTPRSDTGDENLIMFYHVSARHGPAERLIETLLRELPGDVVKVADVAIASFMIPDIDSPIKVKPNGCVSLKDYSS